MNVAVIPARGGSKGILRKNLERVGGQSLVERAVKACLGAASIDRVIVSSDDEAILSAARAAGAEALLRPGEQATDEASSESVLLHALSSVGEVQALVLVQCTSPFIDSSDVDATLQLVLDGADCAFTGTPSHGFLWRRDTMSMAGINHDPAGRLRRQDREPEYLETGAVYAMDASGFKVARHRFFGRIAMHVVPPNRAIEIDTHDELALARLMAPALPTPTHGTLRGIGLVVLDFDGVLTDDGVWTAADGGELVRSVRGDGLGLAMLQAAGVPVEVISKERHPVVAARCRKLNLPLHQGVDDKVAVLRQVSAGHGVDMANIAYVGNDINDLPCMSLVGLPVAVNDAHARVKLSAAWTLTRNGGQGAVRELCELIVSSRDPA